MTLLTSGRVCRLQMAGHRVQPVALGVWLVLVAAATALWVRGLAAPQSALQRLRLLTAYAAAAGAFHAGLHASLTSKSRARFFRRRFLCNVHFACRDRVVLTCSPQR
jgi:hypothetical protein